MITIKQVDASNLTIYKSIPMITKIKSKFELIKQDNGIKGILIQEVEVDQVIKDHSENQNPEDWCKEFDISNWVFLIVFDHNHPIGGATIVSKTPNVNMLEGRDDLAVLWDIRIDPLYQRTGIGSQLFDEVVKWCKEHNLKQLKIESQNNNVPACKFYAKKGCELGQINEYAYYHDEDARDEVMLVWYLDLEKMK